jgi:hypothetical protein
MTIAVKLFSDDLGLALENRFRKKIDVGKLDQEPEKTTILHYIKGELSVILNDKDTLDLGFNSSEENEGAIWFYFSATYSGKIKKMIIQNSLLTDMFHDQTNLVIVNDNGKQNGYRFNYSNREQEIQL